ncbi:MAG: gfo/Idh/MocA family oxidoreductase, partial [Myxococcota bacterium]|nr:gfo/Idh/MocA family oxidoreductase [Myxococcota bacterium]
LTIYRTEDGVEEDTSVNLPDRGGSGSWDHIAAHFIDCILDGVECTAPLRHGLQVQQMMEALLKSASTGREVRLHTSAEEWK